jgi:hypothetical protein
MPVIIYIPKVSIMKATGNLATAETKKAARAAFNAVRKAG